MNQSLEYLLTNFPNSFYWAKFFSIYTTCTCEEKYGRSEIFISLKYQS